MAEGWVITIAHVDEDGGQTDRCWATSPEYAERLAEALGEPHREYLSTAEANQKRRDLDETEGTVIIHGEPT